MGTLRQIVHPAYRYLESKVHPLRLLFIEITQLCNLKCRHCGSDCGRDTHFDELSTDEWLGFFRYLNQHPKIDTRKVALVITGGEPTSHPEFGRILGGLRDNGLRWGMVTNGFSLTRDKVQLVNDHGIVSATVSLDGLEETHDWLRGRKKSFRHAVSAIENLVAAGRPFFDVVTCVHPGNLEQLPTLFSLLQKLQVPQWRLFSIFPKGRARQNEELLLDSAGFTKLMRFIRDTRRDHPESKMKVIFSCEGYLPGKLDKQVRDEPYFCRAGISIGSVLCDGSIAACPNISRELIQGNIRKDDFLEVWEQRYQAFRDRTWMRKGPCEVCEHWKRCLGNSMHLYDDELGHTGLCTWNHLQDWEE